MFLYRYSKNLEEDHYRGKTAEYVIFFLFSIILILIASTILSTIWTSFSFVQVIIYVWSRRNPNTLVSILGYVFRAPYIPYVFLGLDFFFNQSVMDNFIGLLVGHCYYFLEDVFPRQDGGFKIINTPEILKKILNENYRNLQHERQEREELNMREQENSQEDLPGGYDFGGEPVPDIAESD